MKTGAAGRVGICGRRLEWAWLVLHASVKKRVGMAIGWGRWLAQAELLLVVATLGSPAALLPVELAGLLPVELAGLVAAGWLVMTLLLLLLKVV